MKVWERAGIIFSIIAVICTLGFSIWDKLDYRDQIKKSEKNIAKNAYDKLYSDVSQGFYGSEKLKKAIKIILYEGDDLSGMNLSGKWLPQIILKDENLYAINFSKSVFSKLEFRNNKTDPKKIFSDFSGANLINADLSKANFNYCILKKAMLHHANLQGASFYEADLESAELYEAILTQANLESANIRSANLYKADLQDANLVDAKLQEANLEFAKLQRASLGTANLKAANLGRAELQKADLQYTILQDAKFIGANLQGSRFFQANLQDACFHEANLQNADLLFVNNLDIEQLSKVKTLYGAKLDHELMKQVKEKYPHLLEKPDEAESKQDE